MDAEITCTYCENPGFLLSEPIFGKYEHPSCHRRIEYGALLERERIIALLESITDYPRGWDYDNPIESVVALIKGEQK
jgi:hypothetical protein